MTRRPSVIIDAEALVEDVMRFVAEQLARARDMTAAEIAEGCWRLGIDPTEGKERTELN